MAVTYGFFNSLNGDRKYNAEQMSDYFRGIVSEGVFQHLDSGLAVTAGTGLTVNVAAGRAIVQNRWMQNDASLELSISAASETYARIDAVVIRLDWSSRAISIAVKTGTPGASPAAPSLTRNSTTYEMALAYVNVAASATSVTVTDKRSDGTVCGWATVAQSTSGEVDAQLNAMKTGFDGVVYESPAAMVRGNDGILHQILNGYNYYHYKVPTSWSGLYWGNDIPLSVNSGDKVTIRFLGYTGSNFSSLLIQGVKSGGGTDTIKSFTSNEFSEYSFTASANYTRFVATVIRSANEVSVSLYLLFNTDPQYGVGHDIATLSNQVSNIVILNGATIYPHFNFSKVDYFINALGNYQYASGWGTDPNYYPAQPSTTYYFKDANTCFFAEYDENKAFIRCNGITLQNNKLKATTSATTKYVRISATAQYFDKFEMSTIDGYGFYDFEAINRDLRMARSNEIHIGSGQTYTTLRSGIAAAVEMGNCHVYVHPGTYDLTEEFATEISAEQGTAGIVLGNNIYVEFMAGSYVKALFPTSTNWISANFEPFSGRNFVLDGLNIESSNCRYCVHDEQSGADVNYHNVYKNCIMKHSANSSSGITGNLYQQCIGGGLGKHGYIEIIGGNYDSSLNGSSNTPTISYHNGATEGCDGKLYIKDLYLNNNNYLRFGYYGSSTIVTPVFVSGCSMGNAIVKTAETAQSVNDNFSITEWNNIVRS